MRCHIVNLRRDGEGSFTTRGTLRDGHPVPITFTSKIVSNAETSDVRMIHRPLHEQMGAACHLSKTRLRFHGPKEDGTLGRGVQDNGRRVRAVA
jgi:hypothetical protein